MKGLYIEVFTATQNRRSIKKFDDTTISHNDIERIIIAGIEAPSANKQTTMEVYSSRGRRKASMLKTMNKGLEPKSLSQNFYSAKYIFGAKHTLSIMEQVPVTIFIVNP